MDLAALIPQFGNLAWTVVAFVVALSVIVTVHELGHYLVGRWCGIGAEVFSLGLGPVLISRRDRHGTRWQVAAIPFGGYVKFLGDADAASGRDEAAMGTMTPEMRRHTMHGAPLWARAATVAAGPVFNFILSIIVFALVMVFGGVTRIPVTIASLAPMPAGIEQGLQPGDQILAIDGKPIDDRSQLADVFGQLPEGGMLDYRIRRDGAEMTVRAPTVFPALVGSVVPKSAASDIGLRAGDVIEAVDGHPIASFSDLRQVTGDSGGKPLVLSVWRDGTVTDFTLVPRRRDQPIGGGEFETRWMIGLAGATLFEPETQVPGPVEALRYGVAQTWDLIVTSLAAVWYMAAGAISSCNLSSPIGIAVASGDAASQGALTFVAFIASLSAAVGLMNLFPVPILDGGHLVFHAWEAVTRRAPGDRAMRVLMAIGLLMLLSLMTFAVINDLRCK